MNEHKKNLILNFIKSYKVGILSTVSEDTKSQSASMAISETDNLELIFQTPNTSRKYKNLKQNPNVSVVFGWDLEEFITVQYEGSARELEENEINECRQIHITKNPKSKEYAYLSENKYFKIIPKWIRYSDLKNSNVFELSF